MEKLTKESITIKSEGNSNNISKSMNKIKGVNDDLKIQKTSGFYDAMTGIIEFVTKDYVKDNRNTIRFGKSKKVEYYHYLIKKEEEVLRQIPKNKIIRCFRHKQNIKALQKLIKRI